MATLATARAHHDTAADALDLRNEEIAALMDPTVGYTADQVAAAVPLAPSTIRAIYYRLRSKPLDRGRPPLPRESAP